MNVTDILIATYLDGSGDVVLVWQAEPHYHVGYGLHDRYKTESSAINALEKIARKRHTYFKVTKQNGSQITVPREVIR
jgi:hypothetical protein